MDINKVYLTGTVSAVSYRSQRNSFKLKFSLKTEGKNSVSQDEVNSKNEAKTLPNSYFIRLITTKCICSIKRMRLSLRDFIKLSRCGNRVSVLGQLRNFRITDSLGKSSSNQ